MTQSKVVLDERSFISIKLQAFRLNFEIKFLYLVTEDADNK